MASIDGAADMSDVHDFDVAFRIIASDGVTVVFDFNDHDAGWSVVTTQPPGDETSKTRVTADHVDGDYDVQESDAAGDFVLIATVEGRPWTQVKTRYLAARTAWRAEAHYFLEEEIEGVTTRYRTGRPDSVTPGEPDLGGGNQTYTIRWHVQPNPTVTIP